MLSERLPSYGGQALLEGVVMRGSNAVASAVRAPDGHIEIHQEDLTGIYKSSIRKIPFLRGLILLWDALGLGIRFLTLSANVQTGEEEKIEGPALYITLIGSMGLGIALFFVAPAAIAGWVEKLTGTGNLLSNLLEGIIRLLIMIGYIWGIGRMPEIARVFAYHGAEHKTINAYEAHATLTPDVVSSYSLEHPRCGTSFLLTLVVISIIFFGLLGPMPLALRLLSRVLLIPVLAGIAYEYIRWIANNIQSPFVQFLVKPNLALQRLTTREPSKDMLEVSIIAFTTMLHREEELTKEALIV